jgi:choline monooxygenase
MTYAIEEDITRAQTLPGRFYSDPVAFGVMRERVFARTWQWIGDLGEVAKPC